MLVSVASLGVPASTPPVVSVRPSWTPTKLHVNGAVPPLFVSVVDGYATPTSPVGSGELVVIAGAGVIGSVSVFWLDAPWASVTFTVTLLGVDAVGVPVITPAVLRLMPATA